MKILIVGGGIGGLTTALACQHLGLDYELFEAAPEIREVGAGIWVPPNAMQVMKRLGVAEEIIKRGSLLNSISVGGPGGEKWYSLPADKVISKYGFGTVAIHRARLQSLLYESLDKNKVHTGKRLKNFERHQNGITLHFGDDTKAWGDCLIGADGLRSVVRQQLFGEGVFRYSGQTCWRGIVRFRLPDVVKGDMMELWGGQAGQRFAYSQISDDEVYYYATLATPPGGKDHPEEAKKFLHTHYNGFGPLPSAIIEAIEPQTIIRTDLFDLEPIHQWTSDNIALVGDAAHATTPNLGQGAAQAIEDAYVLVSTLKDCLADIPSALKIYQQKRIKKAHYVVNTSWKLGQMTNIRNRFGIKLRNWMIRSTPDFITEKQIHKAYQIDF
jgi:2-polyprenyl-6-methoxyphenol hydroxylase-like FAD-dependent oxidoreductase